METKDDIPEDILKGIDKAFKDDPDTFANVLCFLTICISEKKEEPFIRSLRSMLNNETVFKKLAIRMVESTKTPEKCQEYEQVIIDVRDNFLNDKIIEHTDNGQRFVVAIPPEKLSSVPVAAACFIRAIIRLPPESLKAVETSVSRLSGTVATYGGRALTSVRKVLPVVRVALVAVYLAWNVIKNIKRWWAGEISGTRCVKNILDCGVGVAAGIGGGIGGEMIGAYVGAALGGPAGAACGAVVGAVAGGALAAITAESLSDRLTQWVFGLPKSEALENAHNFIGVSTNASNNDVNSQYRQLARQYHPDKGGDAEKWTRLQYSMAVIRESRGEP